MISAAVVIEFNCAELTPQEKFNNTFWPSKTFSYAHKHTHTQSEFERSIVAITDIIPRK